MARKKKGVINDSPDPPKAPEPGRGLRFSKMQIGSLLLLAAIVGTALAGVYNEHRNEVGTSVGGVDVRLSYTTRFRFQQTELISVTLRNTTSSVIDSVSVAVDTAYLHAFSEVSMIPDPLFAYATDVVGLPPGQLREVRVEARGSRSGMHRGTVTIGVRGDTARLKISTFVLP